MCFATLKFCKNLSVILDVGSLLTTGIFYLNIMVEKLLLNTIFKRRYVATMKKSWGFHTFFLYQKTPRFLVESFKCAAFAAKIKLGLSELLKLAMMGARVFSF